jgi:hypothetical protein
MILHYGGQSKRLPAPADLAYLASVERMILHYGQSTESDRGHGAYQP